MNKKKIQKNVLVQQRKAITFFCSKDQCMTVGVKNLYMEVNVKYIKGMLNLPDLQSNTAINQQYQGILLFVFILVHVLAEKFKAKDVLLRRRLEKDKEPEFNDNIWLESITYYNSGIGKEILIEQIKKATSYLVEELPSIFVVAIFQEKNLEDIFKFLQILQYPG